MKNNFGHHNISTSGIYVGGSTMASTTRATDIVWEGGCCMCEKKNKYNLENWQSEVWQFVSSITIGYIPKCDRKALLDNYQDLGWDYA